MAGMAGIARVAVTFRYFRRTFLEMELAQHPEHGQQRAFSLPPRLPAVFDYVDARFYNARGEHESSHLYAYPALVLQVSTRRDTLTLQYLDDGASIALLRARASGRLSPLPCAWASLTGARLTRVVPRAVWRRPHRRQ